MTSLRGVLVATTTPFADDHSMDRDRYAEHVNWLLDAGVHGVIPNGSLGEYQVLTDEERAQVEEDRARAEAAASLRDEDYQLAYAIDILKGLSAFAPDAEAMPQQAAEAAVEGEPATETP